MEWNPISLRKKLATIAFITALVIVGSLCAPAHAAITYSPSQVSPANPNTWTNVTNGTVGDTGAGFVTVDDGSNLLSTDSCLGNQTNGVGAVTITGTNSKWTNSGSIRVGNLGTGTLRVEAGGAVSSTVAELGVMPSAVGTIIVTGENSLWENSSSLFIGDFGSGTLNIEAGGTVTSHVVACIGCNGSNSGTVNVTGTGSQWIHSGNIQVGIQGTGILNIQNGGRVTAVNATVPDFTGGRGTVIVAGVGSEWINSGNLEVGVQDTGTLNIQNGGRVVVGETMTIGPSGTFNWTGGTLEIKGAGPTNEDLEVPNGGRLTGNGTFALTCSQTVTAGGQSQFTGGSLYTSGGAGYTISKASNYTLADAIYNVLPGGSIQKDNLWKLTAGDATKSFLLGDDFTLSTNDDFATLGDCLGANALRFGASTAGTININHQATIAALNAASTSEFVIGTGGKLESAVTLDMRNANNVTINIAATDFTTGRTIADLGANSWMVEPTQVTLNIASPTGAGTVTLATSTGSAAMSTDGTNEIAQADLDRWIAGLSSEYTIGYDGFDLLLNYTYAPPEPGDSNKVIIEKLIASGDIVLPPGMTAEDMLKSLTTATGSNLVGFTAANTFCSNIASMIDNSTNSAGWRQSRRMSGNNNNLRGQQIARDYRRGKRSLWIENVGSWTTQDLIDETITSYNASLFGIQVGADRMLGRNLIGGIAFAGAWATTQSGSQQMATDIFDLQLYGAWRVSQNLRSIGSIGYQYMEYSGMFLGSNSSHIGNMFKMAGIVECDIQLGNTLLTPIYGWEYYATSEDAYQTGQFAVEGNRTEAIYQRCGARLALLKRQQVKMDFHSSWLHNFGDENIIFSAASGGTPFQLTGAPLHRDLAELGLETTLALSRSLDLTLGYLGIYANGFNTQSVNGLLRYSF